MDAAEPKKTNLQAIGQAFSVQFVLTANRVERVGRGGSPSKSGQRMDHAVLSQYRLALAGGGLTQTPHHVPVSCLMSNPFRRSLMHAM